MRSLVCAFLLSVSTAVFAAPRLVPIPDALISGKSSSPRDLVRAGDYVWFLADDGTHGLQLWRTDGTASGTGPASNIAVGTPFVFPAIIGPIGERVVYLAADGTVWRSGVSAGAAVKLGTITVNNPNTSAGFYVTSVSADTRVFILVQRSYDGLVDLWSTDGTSLVLAGSYRVVPGFPIGVNGKLYFNAKDDAVGEQLWVSDGTSAGTHMALRSIECPGVSCDGVVPRGYFRIGDAAFFVTKNALWKTDGTTAGTVRLAAIDLALPVHSSAKAAYLTSTNGLWKTDGTAAGTRLVGAIPVIRDSVALDDGRLVFVSDGDHFDQCRLRTSDGTAGGIHEVGTIPCGGDSWGFIGAIGSRVFFKAVDAAVGMELWTADVDSGAVGLVKDIDPRHDTRSVFSGDPGDGAVLGGRFLFPATSAAGRELWMSDGTGEGTKLLANIAPDAPAGSISGVVRDAATGSAVESATVVLCVPGATSCSDFAISGADGVYHFDGVTPGAYTAVGTSRQHVAQLYDGTLNVTAGMELAGVDFNLLKGGRITGTVRTASGEPLLFGAQVWVRNSSGQILDQATVFSDGRYVSRGLPTGSYFAEAHGVHVSSAPTVDQLYRDKNCPTAGCDWAGGTPIAVTAGVDTPSIDFALHEYGTISGTLRDASTNGPAAGVQVSFVRSGGTQASATAYSDANGAYKSPRLAPGSYYVRADGGRGFGGLVYPNAPCPTFECNPSAGTPVDVGVDGAVTGIDLQLTPVKGRITGIVRDSTGAPFAGVTVQMRDTNGYYISAYGGPATTDADGRYTFFDIPAGTYYLHAIDELHPNVDCPNNPCSAEAVAAAKAIVLTAGKTVVADMQLRSRRTTVTGRVLDAATGKSFDFGASVSLYDAAAGRYLGGGSNGSTGYKVEVLSRAASFFIIAGSSGYHSIAYPNIRYTCGSTCAKPPGATEIAAGTTTGIDIFLPPLGVISGTVTNAATGAPIASVPVSLRSVSSPSSGGATSTDSNGRYRFSAGDGPYYVYVNPWGSLQYAGQVYRDHDCAAACDPNGSETVSAPDGGETSGIDFHLQPKKFTGRITGRVVDDATGAGLANIYVSARGSFSSFDTRTDAQGNYTIQNPDVVVGLVSGDYHLYAEGPPPYLVAPYGAAPCADFYGCDLYGGAVVKVSAPNTTSGIDFHLARLRITAVAPDNGDVAGGTRLVISGANFTPKAAVKIGDKDAAVLSVTQSEIVVVTPPAAAPGLAHVTVVLSPNLKVTLTQAYLYTKARRRAAR